MLPALLCALLLQAPPATAEPPPNIVLFFVDDLGWGDVGCYGSSIPTPRIDRLAEEGTRFTDFYAFTVCGPSRAMLLTGCYPIRVAEPGNRKVPHTILHPEELTIAELLKERGYATACIGKWHLAGVGATPPNQPTGRGPFDPRLLPGAQGFDEFFGRRCTTARGCDRSRGCTSRS